MANYPYISGQGALIHAFEQLRKSAPPKVDAGYLQRFNIARANESYVISILRFLGIIDENGNRIEDNSNYLYGNEEAFKAGLEKALRTAYSALFDEMNDALEADRDTLIHWFRSSDKTSALVGQRQASTFLTLAALAGHGERPSARASTATRSTPSGRTAPKVRNTAAKQDAPPHRRNAADAGNSRKIQEAREVGLTVRVEINLPPGGDAATYDAIFASIRKHLMS